MMTKREAWLHLATAWDKAKPDHDFHKHYCARTGKLLDSGLCGSLMSMLSKSLISYDVFEEMNAALHKHWPKKPAVVMFGAKWRWPLTKAGAKARAKFCRKMARLK